MKKKNLVVNLFVCFCMIFSAVILLSACKKTCIHTYADWVVTTDYTCTTDGVKTRTCTKCNDTETEIIPASHTLTYADIVSSDCTHTGTLAHDHCSVCNKNFIDGVEKSNEQLIIPIGSCNFQSVAKANQVKYKETPEITHDHPDIDKEMKVRENASELLVITKTKKLAAYVITITEKSPKRFRGVFVNRLQNYCLDCLENLIEANSLRMDSTKNKEKRKDCQHTAYLKLKLLGYMAFLSLESNCILRKQYEQKNFL